jgi:hypothetical protein
MNWNKWPFSIYNFHGYVIEYIFREEQITKLSDDVRSILYGGYASDGYLDKIYKVKGLSDKYILDSHSETIDDMEIERLYNALSELGIDESNSIILTNNVKYSKYEKNMITFPFILFRWITFIKSQKYFPYVPYSESYIEKLKNYRKPHKFMCLNGEVKEARMYLCQELHRKGYDLEGLVSLMDNGGHNIKFYKDHFDSRRFPVPDDKSSFSQIHNQYGVDYPYEFDWEYFSKLPFLLDTIPSENNWTPDSKYWEKDNFYANLSLPQQFIEDCYLQFTSETTFFSSDGRYHHKMDCVSEKTYKSILFHPSLIFGSPGNLTLLKSYGFKTFSPLLDESYDEIKSDSDRFWALFKEIDRLMDLSKDDLHELFVESLPIIEHNQNTLFNMNPESWANKLIEDIKLLS